MNFIHVMCILVIMYIFMGKLFCYIASSFKILRSFFCCLLILQESDADFFLEIIENTIIEIVDLRYKYTTVYR